MLPLLPAFAVPDSIRLPGVPADPPCRRSKTNETPAGIAPPSNVLFTVTCALLMFVKVQVICWPGRIVMLPTVPLSQVADFNDQPARDSSETEYVCDALEGRRLLKPWP